MRELSLLLLLCLALAGATGCAASTEEDTAASNQALTEYEAAVRRGTPMVESDTRPNEITSAKTRLIGFIPSSEIDDVENKLMKVSSWTSIQDKEGYKPFESASVKGDSKGADVRTVTAKVTFTGGIDLDIRGTARRDAKKANIRFVNTSGYKHWLAGNILEPGKLTIDVTLVEMQGGVIVDAAVKVKLQKMEDRAAGLCETLPLVFAWLKVD